MGIANQAASAGFGPASQALTGPRNTLILQSCVTRHSRPELHRRLLFRRQASCLLDYGSMFNTMTIRTNQFTFLHFSGQAVYPPVVCYGGTYGHVFGFWVNMVKVQCSPVRKPTSNARFSTLLIIYPSTDDPIAVPYLAHFSSFVS